MLTAAQVSVLLGISPEDVLKLFKARRIGGYRFGRAVRFSQADVDRYRAANDARHASARVLREYDRLRRMAPAEDRPAALTPEQQAIVECRMRRVRMVPWANPEAIRALRAEARRLTAETGIPHHVDHVIPLQGDFVSGLHVEANMQILTGTENIRKRNRFEPC
jgi:excisionase family DNA binding protein